MYITNAQLKTIEIFLDNPTCNTREVAHKTVAELRSQQKALNQRTRENLAEHRAKDPLYGRSAEYKAKRIEKARRIIEIYGKEN